MVAEPRFRADFEFTKGILWRLLLDTVVVVVGFGAVYIMGVARDWAIKKGADVQEIEALHCILFWLLWAYAGGKLGLDVVRLFILGTAEIWMDVVSLVSEAKLQPPPIPREERRHAGAARPQSATNPTEEKRRVDPAKVLLQPDVTQKKKPLASAKIPAESKPTEETL